jgi:hypothetical protein
MQKVFVPLQIDLHNNYLFVIFLFSWKPAVYSYTENPILLIAFTKLSFTLKNCHFQFKSQFYNDIQAHAIYNTYTAVERSMKNYEKDKHVHINNISFFLLLCKIHSNVEWYKSITNIYYVTSVMLFELLWDGSCTSLMFDLVITLQILT